MAERMTKSEWQAFMMEGTRTAKLATVRKDGRPHVVPIGFVLDGDELLFTTGAETVKGRTLRRDPRVCLCVDDQRPPFSFVMYEGEAELSDDLEAMLPWRSRSPGATWARSAPRSSGAATRSIEGELLVRVRPTNVLAERGIAGY